MGQEVLHPLVVQQVVPWVDQGVLHPLVVQQVDREMMLGGHLEVDPEAHQRHQGVERMLVGMFLLPLVEMLGGRAALHPSEVRQEDQVGPVVDRQQGDLVGPEVGL